MGLNDFCYRIGTLYVLTARHENCPEMQKHHYYLMLRINEYQVDLAIIANGSQAKIARAFNTVTNETLAVKIYSLKDRPSLLCFENEARLLHQLRTIPEVIEARSCFSHKQFGFLVMDLHKHDLLTAIMRENGLGELMALYYFKQICEGVQQCHSRNVAHLDLKPENILLDENEQRVRICDFGNAYQFQNHNEAVHIGRRGTLVYCAPEMKRTGTFNPVDADVWSLGILLHVMAVGYFPHAQSEQAIHQYHEGVVDLSFISGQCSSSFVNLLSMILDPENRPNITSILTHPIFNQLNTTESSSRRASTALITHKLSGMFNLRKSKA